MARKSLNDLSGIAKTIADSAPKEKGRSMAPALGALQGSLSAIRELDPATIDEWGPIDRMEEFTAVNPDDGEGFQALKESIEEGGQQVPILVRKSVEQGRFEVIYGRRRLQACRELGIKVRANVQELSDDQALLAKGLENAARRDLSFYEKARFAKMIRVLGYENKLARQALGLSKSGLSHLTKVTDAVPDKVGDAIGPAPKAGRPKWTVLADAFLSKRLKPEAALLAIAGTGGDSDARLDGLLKLISERGARLEKGREVSPVDGVTIKSGQGNITVSIKRSGKNAAFADWLGHRLESFISESYAKFTVVNPQNEIKGKSSKGG